MNAHKIPDQRWHAIMTNLLYPGVLGALLYSFVEGVVDTGMSIRDPVSWMGVALLLLFTFDYAHTLNASIRQSYGGAEFLLDLLILVALFLAGRAILASPVIEWLPVWALLFIAKGLATIWEASRRGASDSASSRKLVRNIETDLALCAAYLGIGLLALAGMTAWPWFVTAAMLVDTYQYYLHTA